MASRFVYFCICIVLQFKISICCCLLVFLRLMLWEWGTNSVIRFLLGSRWIWQPIFQTGRNVSGCTKLVASVINTHQTIAPWFKRHTNYLPPARFPCISPFTPSLAPVQFFTSVTILARYRMSCYVHVFSIWSSHIIWLTMAGSVRLARCRCGFNHPGT